MDRSLALIEILSVAYETGLRTTSCHLVHKFALSIPGFCLPLGSGEVKLKFCRTFDVVTT